MTNIVKAIKKIVSNFKQFHKHLIVKYLEYLIFLKNLAKKLHNIQSFTLFSRNNIFHTIKSRQHSKCQKTDTLHCQNTHNK